MVALGRVARHLPLLLAILAALAIARRGEARHAARVAPTPSWVDPIDVDFKSSVDAAEARGGTAALLRDVRIRIGKSSIERYQRTVQKAVTQAGVEALAEVTIEYAPDYQELALHRVAVVRNGKAIDQTARAPIRMLDQETDMERRVYRGAATALVVLSDVRPGDVVDVAYSIRGLNPVLGGHYAGGVLLGANEPTRRFYVEVRRDETRDGALKWAVRGKAPAPSESTEGKERVFRWNVGHVAAIPDDDRVPATHDVPADLELSELGSWAEVAAWARGLYPAQVSQSVTEKAAELRAGTVDRKEAILKALRFVQDDVRYLSESLGPFSLRPHTPALVLRQRFGDCKDKSYLLVELLRALDVEAYPALANTDFRESLGDLLPSAFDFDHAIVKVVIDGRSFFVDPTWAHQGGTLDSQEELDLGRVLVLSPGSAALETLPDRRWSEAPRVATNEFTVAVDGKTTLKVTTVYKGSEADGIRAKLASTALPEISHDYANYYEKTFGKLLEVSPLDVNDDRMKNAVIVTERYTLAQFWKDGERTLVPDSLRAYLAAPSVTRRESPLALDHPTWIREVHVVKLPFAPDFERTEDKLDDPAFMFRQVVESNGSEAHATYEYKSLAASVSVAKLEAHLKRLDEARDKVGFTLSRPTGDATGVGVMNGRSDRWASVITGLWLLGGLLVVPVLVLADRAARRRRLKKRVETFDGETPANPLEAATIDEARARLEQSRCPCGALAPVTATEFSTLRYGPQTLHAGTVTCTSCGAKCRLYFAVADAPVGA